MTDEEGKFVLEALDPELVFQLLVYERRHAPTFSTGWVDPRVEEAHVVVEANDLERRAPELVLRGRVVDVGGRPVPRAVVSPRAREFEGGRQYGALPGVDELAVTDEEGTFALGVPEANARILINVDAAGFAPRSTDFLPAGKDAHTIALTRGVTVTGTVRKDGEPLNDVEMGLRPRDPFLDEFTGAESIGTDAAGRFTFVNVPPGKEWNLYGAMASLRGKGALAIRPTDTADDGTTVDVGVLEVEPAATLHGRVVLSDGLPLPEGLHALLDRDEASDAQTALLAPDGSFTFEGLPRERVTLNVRLSGYVVSSRNASCDFINHQGLIGRIDGDISDLVLLLEPGFDEFSMPEPEVFSRYEALCESPLRGATLDLEPPSAR